MKDFVINWGKFFLFWGSLFDLIGVLLVLFLLDPFLIMLYQSSLPETSDEPLFISTLLIYFLSIIIYFVAFVMPKLAIYLFVDISDQLRIIAQNTAPQVPQSEQIKQPEPEQKEETFLDKGIYSK